MFRLLKKNLLFIYCFIALFVATIYVYSDVNKFNYVNYDDNEYVSENYNIQKGINAESLKWCFTAVHSNNWHPVTWISHMVDFSLFGINPAGHHVVSVIIHIVNVFLLFILLYLITGLRWPSLLVSAVFALHPAHVESVAWIAERKDVLSAFFMFLTIISYYLYVKDKKATKWISYVLALILFALGLMSKPMLVTLPFVLLLLDFWPLSRMKKDVWVWLEKIPFFALTIISAVLTFWAQKSMGAVQSVNQFPIFLRIENAALSTIKYIGKLFWPHPLVVFYPYNQYISIITFTLCLLVILFFTFLFLKEYKKRKYLIVGWLWFLGTLVPVIGIVQVGTQAMADRYTYITHIGLTIIIAWWAYEMLKRFKNRESIYAVIIIFLIFLQVPLTRLQASYWEGPIILFEHQLKYEIGTPLIMNNLGLSYSEKGQTDKAIDSYYKALEINPTYFSVLNNLGSALSSKGDIPGSIKYYQKAVDSEPNNPLIYRIYNNLGIAAIYQQRLNDAVGYFEKAMRLEPGYDATYNNMGVAMENLGRLDDAIFYYRQGLIINPRHSGLYNNIGLAYGKKGEVDKAIEYFTRAIQADPNNGTAVNNLSLAKKYKAEGR
jgi:tetratricopeptide (TPR) repeat protein